MVIVLWDEFPSCDREVCEAANRALNDFSGKVVFTMGDIRQIDPVVLSGDKEVVISHSIPSSPLWLKFNRKTLRKMRLQQSQDFLTEVSTTEKRTAAQSQLNYGNMLVACYLRWYLYV